MIKNYLQLVVTTAVLTTTPLMASAQLACHQLFEQATASKSQTQFNAPTFQATAFGKKIPAVLVNADTYANLKPLLNKSLGIAVTHQTGYSNDHGLLRLDNHFIDRDVPGRRGRGEIHETGISWASVDGYLDYGKKSGSSYNRIEVLFELTTAEHDTAVSYQKMRRAGIVRPDFIYGGSKNPANKNNRLNEGGEICFSFSCGSVLQQQIASIESELSKLGLKNTTGFLKIPDVQKYIRSVQQNLVSASIEKSDLNPFVPNNDVLTSKAVKVLLHYVKPAHWQNALNWIVGLALTKDYANLIQTLGIHDSPDFSNVRSARATAILIYDSKVSDDGFLSPDYKSVGAFSTWTHTQQ